MKRTLCFLIAVMSVLCLMTGCNFTSNFHDNTGRSAMEAAPKVEEMLSALSAGDSEAAVVLLHPAVAEQSEKAMEEMITYLDGRKTTAIEQKSVSVNTSSGTAGKARQETGVFQVTLEDSTTFFITATYLTNQKGEGFVSYQLVLGLV